MPEPTGRPAGSGLRDRLLSRLDSEPLYGIVEVVDAALTEITPDLDRLRAELAEARLVAAANTDSQTLETYLAALQRAETAEAALATAREERDLAITHAQQTCKALEKHRHRAEQAEAAQDAPLCPICREPEDEDDLHDGCRDEACSIMRAEDD